MRDVRMRLVPQCVESRMSWQGCPQVSVVPTMTTHARHKGVKAEPHKARIIPQLLRRLLATIFQHPRLLTLLRRLLALLRLLSRPAHLPLLQCS